MKIATKKPKFTIVTVTYNAENFLEDTIKSIIKQTYKDFEYIIIDGKSTDKTLDIIKKYEKHITYWKSELDDGIYYAMNKAIDIANGEYINFMNAGDSFANDDILEKVFNAIDIHVDFLYGGANLISNDKTIKYMSPLNFSFIWEKMPFCHQSLFVKTKIIKKYKFDTLYKINADLDLIFKLNGRKYKILNEAICNFLYDGFHMQDPPRNFLDEIYITSKYMKKCSDIYKHQSSLRFVEAYQNYHEQSNITYKYFNTLLEKINKINYDYKNILLYANTSLCQIIIKFLKISYKVVDIDIKTDNEQFINPKNIKQYNYDAIIVTTLGQEQRIVDFLINLQIPKDKIKTL